MTPGWDRVVVEEVASGALLRMRFEQHGKTPRLDVEHTPVLEAADAWLAANRWQRTEEWQRMWGIATAPWHARVEEIL